MNTIRTWVLRSTLLSAAVLGVTLAVGTLALAGGGAHAGGSCRGMPVNDEATKTVVIENGTCFEPAIVRVEPGSTVTWENPDGGLPHTITGANASWGLFDSISPGFSVAYDFAEEGVYPYYCLLHPGMIGAVIVGDAEQSADGRESVSLIGSAQLARPSVAVMSTSDSGFDSQWLIVPLAAAVAIAMGTGGFVLGARRARG